MADKIGMGATYFSIKKKRGNWTDDEVEKIIQVINSDDITGYFDTLIIKAKMKHGKNISSGEFEERIGWK